MKKKYLLWTFKNKKKKYLKNNRVIDSSNFPNIVPILEKFFQLLDLLVVPLANIPSSFMHFVYAKDADFRRENILYC